MMVKIREYVTWNSAIALGAAVVIGNVFYWLLGSKSKGKRVLKCALHPENYTKCKLISITSVSHNSAIYRFQLPRKVPLNLPIGRHVSIRATVGTRQAVRNYTPISAPEAIGHFDLLVKTYPNGCVSKFLAEMKVGEFAEFKGPKGAFDYEPHKYSHLGMIAGGTGITPMYQVIKHALSDPKDKTKISLIFANLNEDDILLRKELEVLAKAHSERFSVWYTLDNPPKSWSMGAGFVSPDMIKAQCPAPGPKTRILVCGPPPMVASMMGHLTNVLGYTADMVYRF